MAQTLGELIDEYEAMDRAIDSAKTGEEKRRILKEFFQLKARLGRLLHRTVGREDGLIPHRGRYYGGRPGMCDGWDIWYETIGGTEANNILLKDQPEA